MEYRYLVMVTENNNNKYYKMIPGSGGKWTAEYGRIGASCQRAEYSESKFYQKYNEKIRKGYADVTNLHTSVVEKVTEEAVKYKDISDKDIACIIDTIFNWSANAIKEYYTVTSDDVSRVAINKAQYIINSLSSFTEDQIWEFNKKLKELFQMIPRRMSDVSSNLAKKPSDFTSIIVREQALLDTMSGQVTSNANKVRSKTADTADQDLSDMTILEANGLTVTPCTEEEKEEIKTKLDDRARVKFKNAWKVRNKETYENFQAYCKEHKITKRGQKLYYHGSRNQNYWNILIQGLKLHPGQEVQRSGAMFGHGLYFAPKASKSIGYTSINGSYWASGHENSSVLLVFRVAQGKKKDLKEFSPEVSRWTEKSCREAGYDSVYAHAGKSLRNDEVIVYNDAACTVEYLIELKS